jgi:hypothetical protein
LSDFCQIFAKKEKCQKMIFKGLVLEYGGNVVAIGVKFEKWFRWYCQLKGARQGETIIWRKNN